MADSITLSIGRNVGSTPMSEERWRWAREDLHKTAARHCSTVYFRGTGLGLYEGNEEESFTVIASAPEPRALRSLILTLRSLARIYKQDAIAMTVGSTRLLSA